MNRIIVSVVCVVVVSLVAAWASADVLVIDFTEASSMHTSVYRDNNQTANTGGQTPDLIGSPASHTAEPQGAGVFYPLYYFDTSVLAGATINSASFVVFDDWYSADFDNTGVLVRRIITPYLWEAGTGTWGNRWGSHDNGAGSYFVDWNTSTAQGHDWGGTVWTASTIDWGSMVPIESAMGPEIIDNAPLYMGNTGGTWDVQTLVQNWADGTWENKGFVLDPRDDMAPNANELVGPLLTIDYTPGAVIPEPASMALLGTGAIAFLGVMRRRRMKK